MLPPEILSLPGKLLQTIPHHIPLEDLCFLCQTFLQFQPVFSADTAVPEQLLRLSAEILFRLQKIQRSLRHMRHSTFVDLPLQIRDHMVPDPVSRIVIRPIGAVVTPHNFTALQFFFNLRPFQAEQRPDKISTHRSQGRKAGKGGSSRHVMDHRLRQVVPVMRQSYSGSAVRLHTLPEDPPALHPSCFLQAQMLFPRNLFYRAGIQKKRDHPLCAEGFRKCGIPIRLLSPEIMVYVYRLYLKSSLLRQFPQKFQKEHRIRSPGKSCQNHVARRDHLILSDKFRYPVNYHRSTSSFVILLFYYNRFPM